MSEQTQHQAGRRLTDQILPGMPSALLNRCEVGNKAGNACLDPRI